ncbi:unnamed protein product [Lactuca saligna]|uniref:Uncharacterized protein n=1 Tax=Lactuca saligna TaxID=75948 RepID=A0AA35ZDT5_LACSI|nr:unnamed protein product [Lactuca saligna]
MIHLTVPSIVPSLRKNRNFLMDINESHVYVLLNPLINHAQKDLPVNIYESELHVTDGISKLIFVRSSYTIEIQNAFSWEIGVCIEPEKLQLVSPLSSLGEFELIKLNLQPDAKGSYVEVLERVDESE